MDAINIIVIIIIIIIDVGGQLSVGICQYDKQAERKWVLIIV